MSQRINRFYQKIVVSHLRKKFHHQNIHQIPRIKKIVINQGLGEVLQHSKKMNFSRLELTNIATQRVTVTKTRKAIAGFKIRKKIPVGLTVTLRGERIYAFFDRLINLALPRIRDFQGINQKSFDFRGNYNLGLIEQLMFPEISYDQVEQIRGIDISIVTNTNKDKECFFLLKKIGISFQTIFFLFLMTKDTFSETLTKIRNAVISGSSGVEVRKTRMIQILTEILLKEGFIEEILETHSKLKVRKQQLILFLRFKYRGTRRLPVITNLHIISCRRLRTYTKYKEVPKILGGMGLVILSTPQGLITNQISHYCKKGGEVICYVW